MAAYLSRVDKLPRPPSLKAPDTSGVRYRTLEDNPEMAAQFDSDYAENIRLMEMKNAGTDR